MEEHPQTASDGERRMKKEILPKDDGRYIIFYSLEEGGEDEEDEG